MALSQTKESVTVTERAPLLETASTTTHHDIEEEEIERSPSTQPQVALSSLLESVPGVIPEENGRLHVRGSDGASAIRGRWRAHFREHVGSLLDGAGRG